MTKKNCLCIAICLLLAAALLFPVPLRYDDGGTVKYQAILYSVTDYHRAAIDHETQTIAFREGLSIRILGFEIFNNFDE